MSIRRSVRVYPPDEVTTVSSRETDPSEVGLRNGEVEKIWNAVRAYYKTGTQPALALCIRRGGKVILDRAIGHAAGNSPDDPEGAPLRAATPETLYNLFSGSKSLTAMLIHHLDDEGLLHLDDYVAEYIPEFRVTPKDKITIRHLIDHRAGIPTTSGKLDLDALTDPTILREHYRTARSWWRPGRRVAYHAISAGFVLGDIIEVVTGKTINEYMDEVVRQPMGIASLTWGVKPDQLDAIARDTFTGFAQIPPVNAAFRRAFGATLHELVDLTNDPRFLTGVVPSGNCFATPNDASLYYEMLLRAGTIDGKKIFSERTVRRAIRETSFGEFDGILLAPVRYGSGFMLGAKYVSLYGFRTSKVFGHMGLSNVLVWADPERDISVCLMATGKPAITPEAVLWLKLTHTISALIPRDFPGRQVTVGPPPRFR